MKTVLLKATMYYTKVPYSVVSSMYREVCKQRLSMKKIVIPITIERIGKMSRQIRTSAKAVVIQHGKLLAIKVNDGKEEWYILPGGGQDSEEVLSETVEREVREETGLEVRCEELLFVIEGVHGESFHRIDLVFLCDYLGETANAVLHHDTNQVGVEWLDLSGLNKLPLYPSKLRRPIMNFYQGKEYRKYLGNEEIGDPEHLE